MKLNRGPTNAKKSSCGVPSRRSAATQPRPARQAPKVAKPAKADTPVIGHIKDLAAKAATGVLAAAVAAALTLNPAAPANAEPRVVRLPASSNPEIFNAQRTMVEAWTIVGEAFVDPNLNSLDWPEELRRHMIAAYSSNDAPAKAWEQINGMLALLGDPYTRRIDPQEYASFRVSADGELQGIGLLIANELSSTGHLRVLAPIKGGPADRAGILPGDEVISINGEDTQGWSGDQASRILRGRGGTEVRVKLARRTDGIPGVPSRPEPRQQVQIKEVAMRREAVAISPVYATTLPDPEGGEPVGYIRLSQFSNNAAQDMRQAVLSLERQGAGQYILDLRSNPGGLVKAGVDVASMWLDGEQTVFTVASREEGLQVQTTENRRPALTHAPLVVLVDNMSASASEIVSGALHDNGRAVIMGDSNTYGKGRIQSVFELEDGSALFVTVAKYATPGGNDIDRKGIHPDRTCRSAPVLSVSLPSAGSVTAPSTSTTTKPIAPPMTAALPPAAAPVVMADDSTFMPGVPLDKTTEELLLEALSNDRCVLAAEHYLDSVKHAIVASRA